MIKRKSPDARAWTPKIQAMADTISSYSFETIQEGFGSRCPIVSGNSDETSIFRFGLIAGIIAGEY